MNKLLKWLLAISAIISSLFLLLALLIYFFVDINHYKEDIEQLVKSETGLDLNISGDLRLSVITGVKFTATNANISYQQETIADIALFDFELKPSSILLNTPVISHISLDIQKLKVTRDKKGKVNFLPAFSSSLKEKSTADTVFQFKQLSIEDIRLNIDKLVIEDEGTSLILNIEQLDADLSFLPVIDHQNSVIDDPQVLTQYDYEGSLKAAKIKIISDRFEPVQLTELAIVLNNRQGKITTSKLNFKLSQSSSINKNKTAIQNHSPLALNASGKITATIGYTIPPGAHEPLWDQPDSIIINQLDLLINDLTYHGQAGQLKTTALSAELKSIPLFRNATSLLADLLIHDLQVKTQKIEFQTTQNRRYLIHPSIFEAENFPLIVNKLETDKLSTEILERVEDKMSLKVDSKGIEFKQYAFKDIHLQLIGKTRRIDMKPIKLTFSNAPFKGQGHIELAQKKHKWNFQFQGHQVDIEAVTDLFGMPDAGIQGQVDMKNSFSGVGIDSAWLINHGDVDIKGTDIQINGFNMDAILDNFENTQNVGLLDIGAYTLLGPAGPLVTKGNDYINLTNSVLAKGKSHIKQLRTHILIDRNIAKMKDVALATEKHRLVFKGDAELKQQTFIDFHVATVDIKGCAIYEESISGTFNAPKTQKVNLLVKGVINPITSVVTKVTHPIIGRCQTPFYTGSVSSP